MANKDNFLKRLWDQIDRRLARHEAVVERQEQDEKISQLVFSLEEIFGLGIRAAPKSVHTRMDVLDIVLKSQICDHLLNQYNDREFMQAFSLTLPITCFRYLQEEGGEFIFPALDRLAVSLAEKGYVISGKVIMAEYADQLPYVINPLAQEKNPGIFQKYISTVEQRFSEKDPPGVNRQPKSSRRLVIDELYSSLSAAFSVQQLKGMTSDSPEAVRINRALSAYPYPVSGTSLTPTL